MSSRYTASRRDVLKQGAALGTMAAMGSMAIPRFAPGASAAQLARNETLYTAGFQWGPPTSFNPFGAVRPWPVQLYFPHIFESPYTINFLTGEIDPLLAAGPLEEDAEGAQFTLHEGITFHDGEALTAEDVVYSIMLPFENDGIPYGQIVDYITGAEAVDDLTVRITYNPEVVHPTMVRQLLTQVSVVPQHIWADREAEGIVSVVDMEPVGSGPYQVQTASAEQVIITRFEDYWGAEAVGMPVPKTIVHPIFDSNDAGNLAFQRAEVDVSQQFAPQIWQMWEDQELPVGTWYKEEPYHVPGGIPIMHINVSRPGLDNPEVRRALAHAINFAQIAETAMSRYSQPAFPSLIVPKGAEEQFFDEATVTGSEFAWEYNPERAKEILETELGATLEDGVYVLEDGTRLGPWKVQCPYGWTDWMTALELVAQGAQEVGIDITTEFPEAPQVTINMQNGDFDLGMWPIATVGATGPWLRFRDILDNRGVPEFGQTAFRNFNRFKNEEAEGLLDQIPTAADADLVAHYARLDEIFRENVPAVPLMYRPVHFFEFNETYWTGWPTDENPYAPPTFHGSGIKMLYGIEPVEG